MHEIEEFDENGTLLRKYVYREEIDSIAMMEAADVADVDGDQNTSELIRLFFHYDGRTNVCALTDASESIVESYECDPYGNLSIKDKNGSGVSVSQVGNPFVFQRRRYDFETGLYFFRARYFSPDNGAWIQRDPLGLDDGGNVYEGMRSNPVSFSDALGTSVGSGLRGVRGGVLASPISRITNGLGGSGILSELVPEREYDKAPEFVISGIWFLHFWVPVHLDIYLEWTETIDLDLGPQSKSSGLVKMKAGKIADERSQPPAGGDRTQDHPPVYQIEDGVYTMSFRFTLKWEDERGFVTIHNVMHLVIHVHWTLGPGKGKNSPSPFGFLEGSGIGPVDNRTPEDRAIAELHKGNVASATAFTGDETAGQIVGAAMTGLEIVADAGADMLGLHPSVRFGASGGGEALDEDAINNSGYGVAFNPRAAPPVQRFRPIR